MPMYGKSLEQYFKENDNSFECAFIIELGSKLIETLQLIHEAGYTYNDLKLDNILLDTDNVPDVSKVRLIDFGFADKYLDSEGNHLPE